MPSEQRIADVDAVPEASSLLFTVRERETDERREAILVRADDGVTAWLNYCQHWPGVTLDRGDGAEIRNGLVLCRQHGATFECDSGDCTAGPCEGDALDGLDVRTVDGEVILDDETYAFAHRGGRDADSADDPFGF